MALGKRNVRSSTQRVSGGKRLTATYQTRIREYAGTNRETGDAVLNDRPLLGRNPYVLRELEFQLVVESSNEDQVFVPDRQTQD